MKQVRIILRNLNYWFFSSFIAVLGWLFAYKFYLVNMPSTWDGAYAFGEVMYSLGSSYSIGYLIYFISVETPQLMKRYRLNTLLEGLEFNIRGIIDAIVIQFIFHPTEKSSFVEFSYEERRQRIEAVINARLQAIATNTQTGEIDIDSKEAIQLLDRIAESIKSSYDAGFKELSEFSYYLHLLPIEILDLLRDIKTNKLFELSNMVRGLFDANNQEYHWDFETFCVDVNQLFEDLMKFHKQLLIEIKKFQI